MATTTLRLYTIFVMVVVVVVGNYENLLNDDCIISSDEKTTIYTFDSVVKLLLGTFNTKDNQVVVTLGSEDSCKCTLDVDNSPWTWLSGTLTLAANISFKVDGQERCSKNGPCSSAIVERRRRIITIELAYVLQEKCTQEQPIYELYKDTFEDLKIPLRSEETNFVVIPEDKICFTLSIGNYKYTIDQTNIQDEHVPCSSTVVNTPINLQLSHDSDSWKIVVEGENIKHVPRSNGDFLEISKRGQTLQFVQCLKECSATSPTESPSTDNNNNTKMEPKLPATEEGFELQWIVMGVLAFFLLLSVIVNCLNYHRKKKPDKDEDHQHVLETRKQNEVSTAGYIMEPNEIYQSYDGLGND